MQSAEFGAKLGTSKLPLRKVPAVQDAENSSNLVAMGHHIEDQVGGKDNKFLDSKPSYLCYSIS